MKMSWLVGVGKESVGRRMPGACRVETSTPDRERESVCVCVSPEYQFESPPHPRPAASPV